MQFGQFFSPDKGDTVKRFPATFLATILKIKNKNSFQEVTGKPSFNKHYLFKNDSSSIHLPFIPLIIQKIMMLMNIVQ